ncbi:hypothetical protein K435DRAFT_840032 [Dendrothele bispora CBS 962.96]|uniref:Uncharacterized protein n=1 Tax=Dendrothele bispora (strain CBS 962.96) TaxID=1314807 RepID=A0A4S8LWA9_DENBC|nr:hypothetical protein K435DRAFT_840032 [Dendrothele bispora CBS 962.96]
MTSGEFGVIYSSSPAATESAMRGTHKKVARKVDPIVDNGANEELSNERVPKESQLTEFYDHWSQVLRVLQGTQIFIDHCYSFGADTGQALRLIERRAVERNLRSLEDAYYGLLWIGPVNELSSRYTAQDKRVINRNVEHVETYHEHKVDSNSQLKAVFVGGALTSGGFFLGTTAQVEGCKYHCSQSQLALPENRNNVLVVYYPVVAVGQLPSLVLTFVILSKIATEIFCFIQQTIFSGN